MIFKRHENLIFFMKIVPFSKKVRPFLYLKHFHEVLLISKL
eukprot:UN11401